MGGCSILSRVISEVPKAAIVVCMALLVSACSDEPAAEPLISKGESLAMRRAQPTELPAPIEASAPSPVAPARPENSVSLGWAMVLDAIPDPSIVTNADFRARIEATRLPWRVRDNRTNIEMLLVPPGEFTMGSGAEDLDAQSAEKPAHRMTITKAFYLGRYEVTQLEWERVRNMNPSAFFSPNFPVQRVSFAEALIFLQETGLRLPTEAEWDYACRAGASDPRYGELNTVAICEGNSKKKPGFVGLMAPNALGFHDMLGNAMEWCSDFYSPDYYAQSASGAQDASGPESGTTRVMRGGSWAGIAKMCRASYRYGVQADYRGDYNGDGLRVVRNP